MKKIDTNKLPNVTHINVEVDKVFRDNDSLVSSSQSGVFRHGGEVA